MNHVLATSILYHTISMHLIALPVTVVRGATPVLKSTELPMVCKQVDATAAAG